MNVIHHLFANLTTNNPMLSTPGSLPQMTTSGVGAFPIFFYISADSNQIFIKLLTQTPGVPTYKLERLPWVYDPKLVTPSDLPQYPQWVHSKLGVTPSGSPEVWSTHMASLRFGKALLLELLSTDLQWDHVVRRGPDGNICASHQPLCPPHCGPRHHQGPQWGGHSGWWDAQILPSGLRLSPPGHCYP